jgi:hypothetical protein
MIVGPSLGTIHRFHFMETSMSERSVEVMAFQSGRRLRELTTSAEWRRFQPQPLRESFGQLAAGDGNELVHLRALVLGTGVRASDLQALQDLAAEHIACFWRGYYGAVMPGVEDRSSH